MIKKKLYKIKLPPLIGVGADDLTARHASAPWAHGGGDRQEGRPRHRRRSGVWGRPYRAVEGCHQAQSAAVSGGV